MTPLSPAQLRQVILDAGFPPEVATTMHAIALRESGGCPDAFNGNAATGDKSVGLFQINILDKGIRALVASVASFEHLPLSTDEELIGALKDPQFNASVAYRLWGGKNGNLDVAWYINRGPAKVGTYDYKGEYERHLPAAQAAALGVA